MSDAAEVDVALSQIGDLLGDSLNCGVWPATEVACDDATGASAGMLGALRVPFRATRQIAPLVDGRPPRASEFFVVRCHDLSIGGFSFYLDREPEFRQLVAAIDGSPGAAYVVARVAHWREVGGAAADSTDPQPSDGDQTGSFLVGCQFLRRLDSSENSEGIASEA